MMIDVRNGRDHLTSWIRLTIKKELEAYFTHDEGFKHCRLTNVANRVLPRSSKYKGGSSESLDHEATLAETFKYTHILKANNERFADERSVAHYEDYTHRLEAAT
ncbi:hypothetical protein Ahy_B04g070789 isoform A [Arachis hypogaea]|uniref:Uncharacterized protein n=1 Tax=Arachis hypogaea TaxID=3818 RepID=A0A444ZJ97_ARAHY|nr:hypothetical protein Ahy_B04g070789 isoform A [Arachis hypogaea]